MSENTTPAPWPWPWPDFEPAPEPVVHYVLRADGVLSQITSVAGQDPVLPEGAQLLSQEVFEELRARMRDAHAERVAELQAAEEAQQRAAYEALAAVPGIPEAVARALSGYTGAATTGA